ncbi:unnamed protein product [Cuscuta epithymum]|uniref:Uncharacterized protein n=1 Tax=Cuscuta epithymum TaxID=186058 RepID=A0AAV0DRE8_9ASTE|nr:unnamed protein product [Cuscuta epithymum]
MEGLIPYLLHAVRKQKPRHHHHTLGRCLSDNSNRSYHPLIGPEPGEGSTHRRTVSDFHAPAMLEPFPDQSSVSNRSSAQSASGGGSVMSPAADSSKLPNNHRPNSDILFAPSTSGYQAYSTATAVNHRR